MRIPAISGQIDRRILVNFRVAPDALEKILPAPFRPQLYRGYGIAGICLIRLRYVRPRFLPLLQPLPDVAPRRMPQVRQDSTYFLRFVAVFLGAGLSSVGRRNPRK